MLKLKRSYIDIAITAMCLLVCGMVFFTAVNSYLHSDDFLTRFLVKENGQVHKGRHLQKFGFPILECRLNKMPRK